jgi:Transmembrane domain of unknown function (DUF3566)
MAGNVPEEDGVEHRVEPQAWLVGGDAETAAPERDTRFPDADGQGDSGGGPVADASLNGSAGAFADPVGPAGPGQDPDLGLMPAGQASGAAGAAAGALRMPPPYPAAVAEQGAVGRITAPFSTLTRTKGKRPKAPKPARPPKPPKPQKNVVQKRPQVTRPVPQTGPAGPAGAASTRKAQLVLSRVEPWSVMKFSFMISLVGWVVLFVAVAAIYYVLAKIGVFKSIESTVGLVTSSKGHDGTNAASWFAASRVLGYTMLAGAVNVVLITALATVGAVVYNLVTHLAGGIEVTLKETD